MFKRRKSLSDSNLVTKINDFRKKSNPLPQKIICSISIASLVAAGTYTTLGANAQVDEELNSQILAYYMDTNNVIVFPTAEISMITLSQENVSEIDNIYNFKDEVQVEAEADYEILGNVENICYDIYSGDEYVSNEISTSANIVVEDALASIDDAMADLDEIAQAEAERIAAEEAAKAAEEAAKLAASYVDNPNMVIKLTNEELDLLERLVQCEAGGEDMVGKILVANVVINRVNSKRFPNTVSGVINANRQFAPVTSGIINTTTASSDTKKAVARALSGEDYSDGALFFISRSHCSKSSAAWFDDNFEKVVEHGGHEFFK